MVVRAVRRDAAPVQKPAAGPVNAEPARDASARHLLMVMELEPATHVARTLTARFRRLAAAATAWSGAQQAPWRVDVLAEGGAVLFSAPLEDAATVRGEFPDGQGAAERRDGAEAGRSGDVAFALAR